MVRALFAASVALLCLSPVAQAREAVLMVNMNYSSEELRAARDVATKRGQDFYVVPPESMIPSAEPLFKLKLAMEDKIKKMHPDWTKSQIAAVLNEFQRRGRDAEKDPGVTAALGSDVDQLYTATNALAAAEKKLGPLDEQVRAKAAELKKKGVRVDTLILSGHSDGANLSGESTLRLSSADIDRVRSENPEIFSTPRHVLLLGCYNLTDTNRQRWRGDLFPNASMIAGFGVQAPSRWLENAIRYISDTLGAADRLDDQMIQQNSPLDKGYVTQVFRKLSSVLNTQSVIDYCLNLVEGQPGNAKISCEEQWNSFVAQADKIKAEYLDLRNATTDPPEDPNGGVLRTFYNLLQNTCPAAQNASIPADEKAAAERFRTSTRESVIRLINWANVQKNFHTYFADDIDEVDRYLSYLGVRAEMPELDGTVGRIEFTRAHRAVEDAIAKAQDDIQRERLLLARSGGSGTSSSDYRRRRDLESRELGLAEAKKKFLYLYRPLYALRGESTVSDGDQLDEESTLARGGIPFNWIEGGAVLSPRTQQ